MKFKKSIIIGIVLLVIVIIAVKSQISASNDNQDNSVPIDRTSVILVKDENDEKLIHVRLGMKEDASVASFQIGLDLDITNDAEVEFTWSENLNEEKFKECRYNKPSNDTSDRLEKRLNLYYVGTQELNDGENNELDIGTIKITENKEATVKISPDAEFTTIESIGYTPTELEIKEEDTLSYIMNDETPGTPETPGTSETPGTPGTPETPGTSETPGTPETPGTSENPGTSETPGIPGTLETPGTPEKPEEQKDKGVAGIIPIIYPNTGIVWVNNVLFAAEIVVFAVIILAIIRRINKKQVKRSKH